MLLPRKDLVKVIRQPKIPMIRRLILPKLTKSLKTKTMIRRLILPKLTRRLKTKTRTRRKQPRQMIRNPIPKLLFNQKLTSTLIVTQSATQLDAHNTIGNQR